VEADEVVPAVPDAQAVNPLPRSRVPSGGEEAIDRIGHRRDA
jgi:hypothetical protein